MRPIRNTSTGLGDDSRRRRGYRAAGGLFLRRRGPSRVGRATIRRTHPAFVDLRTGVNGNLLSARTPEGAPLAIAGEAEPGRVADRAGARCRGRCRARSDEPLRQSPDVARGCLPRAARGNLQSAGLHLGLGFRALPWAPTQEIGVDYAATPVVEAR